MATNYVQDGQTINFTNDTGALVESGAVVVVGAMVGIAVADIPVDETGAVLVEGVFSLPKATGAIAIGDAVDYDVSAKKFAKVGTPASGDLVGVGVAWAAAASGDTEVAIKINAGPAAVTA